MNLYNSNQSYPQLTLNQKINLETARINWHELKPHFARGVCIYVAPQLDLVATAEMIVTDNITTIEFLIQKGKIGFISDQ